MSKATTSRRKIFQNAGLDPDLFDSFCAEAQAAIIKTEAVSGDTWLAEDFQPDMLRAIYESAQKVWIDHVLTPEQKAQADIQYKELYSLPGYMIALYECWYNWTIKSTFQAIKFLKLHPELQRPTVFLADGVGLAGLMYAHAFPQTSVTSHIMGDSQLAVAQALGAKVAPANWECVGGQMIGGTFAEWNVMAFECFEHFYEPQTFAPEIIAKAKMLVHSSPWKVSAHGHFVKYKMDGQEIDRADMPRAFGKWLRSVGFVTSAKLYGYRPFNGDPSIELRCN